VITASKTASEREKGSNRKRESKRAGGRRESFFANLCVSKEREREREREGGGGEILKNCVSESGRVRERESKHEFTQ